MSRCRLIIDPPASGTWNMAVDDALLASLATHTSARSEPTLRLYRWAEPTLSLGYFQNYQARQEHAESRECRCVRRHSGGGAILHDHELTYSLVLPLTHNWSRAPLDLYTAIHGGLVENFKAFGANCQMSRSNCDSNFLCFQRRSPGDILLLGAKIVGSAERRSKGALLQHGSLLLRKSSRAPQLTGIEDLIGRSLPSGQLEQSCAAAVEHALGFRLEESCLTSAELAEAAILEKNKFASREWTQRR